MAKFQSRPFDDADWSAFAGCESDNPRINDFTSNEVIVILDGNVVSVLPAEGNLAEWANYEFESPELADEIANAALHVTSPEGIAWLFR